MGGISSLFSISFLGPKTSSVQFGNFNVDFLSNFLEVMINATCDWK